MDLNSDGCFAFIHSNDLFILDLSWRHTSGRQPKHDAANLWRGGMDKTDLLVNY